MVRNSAPAVGQRSVQDKRKRGDHMQEVTKLSDYVMRFVAAQGVGHGFMLPGDKAKHLNDSLGRCDGSWSAFEFLSKP